jgi:hypothetical protein
MRYKQGLSTIRQTSQSAGIRRDSLRIPIFTPACSRYQKTQNPDRSFMRVASIRYMEHRKFRGSSNCRNLRTQRLAERH